MASIFAPALALLALSANPARQSGEHRLIAVVRYESGATTAAPKTWDRDGIELWAREAGLVVSFESNIWTAYPADLCGLRQEHERLSDLVAWAGASKLDRVLDGALVPSRLAESVANVVASGIRRSDAPPEVSTMDFSLGVHGWFQLSDGTKSVWLMAETSDRPDLLRSGKCSPLPPGASRVAPQPSGLEFNAFRTVSVDLLEPAGLQASVRDRADAARSAMDRFHEAVVEASEAIRSAYQALYSLSRPGAASPVRDALGSEAAKAGDLPGAVATVLRGRLTSGYSQYGFASAEEADRFFAVATLQSKRARLALEYVVEDQRGRKGASAEFSGPFTPRG